MDLLLNWLAQGVVVEIAAAAGLRLIPASRAQARYGFLWAGYLLVLALPVFPSIAAAAPIAMPPLDLSPVPDGPVAMPAAWWTSSALALSLWMTWSGLQAVRFIVGAVAVRRARRLSEECPHEVLADLPHWSRVRTTGRPARVVLSDRVRHAAVLGFGSPVIALAPRLVTQLSRPDLDRVLVHEWAHVQRRDDLAQLLQQLVRAIAGWHPAVWWLERRLDFEREVACDEVAVDVTGSAKGYAACLVTLAAMVRAPIRSLPGLAAVSPSQLRGRLERILLARWITLGRARVTAICGAAGLAALALAVSQMRAVSPISGSTPASIVTDAQREPSAAAGVSAPLHQAEPTPPRSSSPARRAYASATVQHVPREQDRSREGGLPASEQSPGPAGPSEMPLPLAGLPSTQIAAPLAPSIPDAQLMSDAAAPTRDAPPAPDKARTPWAAAADAGVAIGRTSQSAGAATAGFFSRFGKKIARSF